MKIYVLDSFYPDGVAYAAQRAEVIRWDDPRAGNWHEDADGVMVRVKRISAEDMARARKLRVISKQGVGLDNIDLAAAKARGIAVCRTPGVNKEAVAEMALALALGVVRRVSEFDRQIRPGGKVERAEFLGHESWQKTVGIVGMGNIGTLVARKWRGAFDASIIAYDPYVPADRWSELPHRRAASLAEMLPQVDILSLHLPLTPESHDMIGDAARRRRDCRNPGAQLDADCRAIVRSAGRRPAARPGGLRAHDSEKHALRINPRVRPGLWKRPCSREVIFGVASCRLRTSSQTRSSS